MKRLYNKLLLALMISCTFYVLVLPATSHAATSPTRKNSYTLKEALALGLVKPVYGSRKQTSASNKAIRPNTLTLWWWIAHDAEVVNTDQTWCLAGSGSVSIYNVTDISNVNSTTDVFFGVRGAGSIIGYTLFPNSFFYVKIFHVVCISVGGTC